MSVLGDLEQLERRIVERAAELREAVDEYAELRQAASKLGIDLDVVQAPSAAARTSKSAAAPKRRASKTRATAKCQRSASKGQPERTTATRSKPVPGGSRRRGSRREQVLQLVKNQPGITVPELGKALKVNSTGLYRVVRDLETAGELKKDGKALTPAAG